MNKISWYRIKLLLMMADNAAGKKQRRLTPLLMFALPVFLAGYFVWLDLVPMLYENMIIIMYFTMPCIIFSFWTADKTKTENYLLLPASTAEKLIAFIIQSVGVSTMIFAIAIPAVILMQGVINLRAGETMLSYMPVLEALTANVLLTGLFLQAIGGFAALVFRKWVTLKGMILVFPFWCIIIIVQFVLKSEGIMNGIALCLFNAILLFLTVSVWILNYYRLKKREI